MSQQQANICPVCHLGSMNKPNYVWHCDHCGKIYTLDMQLRNDQQRAGVSQAAKEIK